MKLSENDRIEIHGFVDVAGLENGEIYDVKDVENGLYVLESISDGRVFRVRPGDIDCYIDSKTFIERL